MTKEEVSEWLNVPLEEVPSFYEYVSKESEELTDNELAWVRDAVEKLNV